MFGIESNCRVFNYFTCVSIYLSGILIAILCSAAALYNYFDRLIVMESSRQKFKDWRR